MAIELLTVLELAEGGLAYAFVNFDPGDIDAALGELEARYLTGEAAPHADAWSVFAASYAAFNRRELPPTAPGWVNIDHRRGGTAFAPGEQISDIHATWDVAPEVTAYAEVVHRLNSIGTVVTQVVKATSREGFDTERREIVLMTVDGDVLSRSEMYDEADLDAALVRFDELTSLPTYLENAATCARVRVAEAFNRRDLDGYLAVHDGRYEDRRKALRNQGPVDAEFARALFFEAPTSWQMNNETLAVRGTRFALTRVTFVDAAEPNRPVAVELLAVTEVNDDGLISYMVAFDPDDLEAAIWELDRLWIASGEVAHPEVVETARRQAELTNRHDWNTLTDMCTGTAYVNHRMLGDRDADFMSSMRAMASLVPDVRVVNAEILALSATGLLSCIVVSGTSMEGLAVEIPFLHINLFDGDRSSHIETFDPDKRAEAIARFDQLNRTT